MQLHFAVNKDTPSHDLLTSEYLGLVLREGQYLTVTYILSLWLMAFQPLIHSVSCSQKQQCSPWSLILTSPILPCRAHCLSLPRWCTPSHTETHPALGYVCVSCPCVQRVYGLRPPLLKGWNWCHGRRPLMVGWWSSLSTCRTATRRTRVFIRGPWNLLYILSLIKIQSIFLIPHYG